MWVSSAEFREEDQINGFECGLESVDSWLQDKALRARPNVRTTLYIGEDDSVVGFHAAKTIIVDVNGAVNAFRQGCDRAGLQAGYLLAQMGVRRDLHGQGVGAAILKEAMMSAVRAYEESPFGLFVVDAENEELVPYYEQFGLRPLQNDLRLVVAMRKIVKGLRVD